MPGHRARRTCRPARSGAQLPWISDRTVTVVAASGATYIRAMGWPTWVAVAMLSGCWAPAPGAARTGSPSAGAAPRGSSGPWQLSTRDLVNVIDRRVIVWDRDWHGGSGGLAEVSAIDGAPLRTRSIAGVTDDDGDLRLWQAVPGGYLAFWDSPALIREHGDALALTWTAPVSTWTTEHVVLGGTAIFVCESAGFGLGPLCDGADAAVVGLALDDGREAWRATLPAGTEDVAVSSDGELVYVTWSEPDPARRIRALEPATGRARWTYDLAASPGALAVAHEIAVAAIGGELHFIDCADGRERAQVALGHPEVYPALAIDRDRAYVAHGDAVIALTLATGQTLWRAPVALDGGPRLAISGGDVVVSTAAATVLALDRASGDRRWEVGLGIHPLALIATGAAVVGIGPDGAAGFGLPVSAPVEAARLRGRVVAGLCGALDGAIVTVGGTRVPLDATGQYSAHVTARGFVTISAAPAQPSSLSAPSTAVVRLDGRRDYRVPDLTSGRCTEDTED